MKTFKKSLAVVLAVLMMLSIMIVGGVSTNAAEYGTDSVTFKAGETIYYDLTQYGSGCNVYSADGKEKGDWKENTGSIIAVKLTSDLTITSNSNLLYSGANGWDNGVKADIPTEGQNMIVSTDGKTAHWDTFVEPEKVESTVYFKNTVNWENVYFYGGVYWDSSKGSGSKNIAVGPVAMTKVEGTDDVFTCTVNAPAFTKVAFTKKSQTGYGNFWQTEAVYSDAFDAATPLFTPDASAISELNSTKYYGGSWSTYGVEPTETSSTTESTQATTASTEATQPTTQPASEPADTVTLYCKCEQSWWKADGAAVGVHYWGGANETTWPGVRGTAVEGETDLWQFEVPADASNIIFSRVNGSGDIAAWGAQTSTLSIPTDGTNLYTITSTSASWGKDNPVIGEWSVYGAEPVETNYTVVFKYETVDGTQTLTKTTTLAESDITKVATSVMPNIDNKMYSYTLGDCELDGTTITANLNNEFREYTVTVDDKVIRTDCHYKDKVTVTLENNSTYTFYVTGDTVINSTDMAIKNEATISLDAVTVTDEKVSLDLLATAKIENFARMGVAFATSDKSKADIEDAVLNVATDTAVSNKIAVHNSTVDSPNVSGYYQFVYTPFVSRDKATTTLYFYTFVVDTDGRVEVSSGVPVDLANAVA